MCILLNNYFHIFQLNSSHGYAENQLCLWKYPTMTKLKELRGHSARVLHMASSPGGNLVCSAAADETLRFWNIFNSSGMHYLSLYVKVYIYVNFMVEISV